MAFYYSNLHCRYAQQQLAIARSAASARSAYFYKQAPMRAEAVVKPDEPSKEETAPLNAGTQEVEGGGTAQDREEEI